MSARGDFHALLKPLLPVDWHVLPYVPTKGTVGKSSVWIQQTRVERNSQAPAIRDDTSLTLTLVQPSQVPPQADDLLDADLDTLLNALDRLSGVTWSGAERAVADDTYPAYTITVTFLTSRKD